MMLGRSPEVDRLCGLDNLYVCINGLGRPPTLANGFWQTISTSKFVPPNYTGIGAADQICYDTGPRILISWTSYYNNKHNYNRITPTVLGLLMDY